MEKNVNIQVKLKLFRALILCAFLIFLGIFFVLFCFQMEETVIAQGSIEPESRYDLTSLVHGEIVEIYKQEGETTIPGEVIMELDSTALKDDIEMLKADIKELHAELKVKNNNLEILVKDPLPAYYRHSGIILKETAENLRSAKINLERHQKLYKKKVIAKALLEKLETAYVKALTAHDRAKKISDKVKSGLGERILNKARNEIALLETKLKNEQRRLQLMKNHMKDYWIKAPEAGLIVKLPQSLGSFVEPGDLVVEFAATNKKKLIAMVDEREVFRIQVGQKTRITSSVYNYFYFGYFTGEIIRIKDEPVKKQNRLVYPVEVLITDEPYQLPLGSSAELAIITGRDRIVKVLFGLNNSIKQVSKNHQMKNKSRPRKKPGKHFRRQWEEEPEQKIGIAWLR